METNFKNLKNKGIIIFLFILAFLLVPGWTKIFLAVLGALAAFLYFGEDKVKAFLAQIWSKTKDISKDLPKQNVDEELTVRDVACVKLPNTGNNPYQIEVVTEKGLLKLVAQSEEWIPECLKKGRKVRHKIIYTLNGLEVQKEETILSIGEKEEKIFYVAVAK